MRGGPVKQLDPIAELDARAQRHAVAVDGGTVTWRRWGTGSPLVLLHGGHGSWLHWLCNIDALAEDHSVWVPDMPGYGDSSPPAQADLASLVAALQASLAALLGATTPIALAGFSFGGLVATHLAVRRGDVVRLALLGAAGHGGARRPHGTLQAWRPAHHAGDALALQSIMRHNLLVHMLHSEAHADETAVRIHMTSCVQTRFHSRTISQSGGLMAMLDAYRHPSLLLWGEHDVTATPSVLLPQLVAGLAHRHALMVNGAGHWVAFEAAEQVNAQLRAFFCS